MGSKSFESIKCIRNRKGSCSIKITFYHLSVLLPANDEPGCLPILTHIAKPAMQPKYCNIFVCRLSCSCLRVFFIYYVWFWLCGSLECTNLLFSLGDDATCESCRRLFSASVDSFFVLWLYQIRIEKKICIRMSWVCVCVFYIFPFYYCAISSFLFLFRRWVDANWARDHFVTCVCILHNMHAHINLCRDVT